MKIVLNGSEAEIEQARLDLAMEELGYACAKVATAVNGEFVATGSRAQTHLSAGDALEVVAPLQGG